MLGKFWLQLKLLLGLPLISAGLGYQLFVSVRRWRAKGGCLGFKEKRKKSHCLLSWFFFFFLYSDIASLMYFIFGLNLFEAGIQC